MRAMHVLGGPTCGAFEHKGLLAAVQGPDVAIHHGEGVLAGMNEWSTQQHGASGLTQRCRESTTSMREAEDQVGVARAALTLRLCGCCCCRLRSGGACALLGLPRLAMEETSGLHTPACALAAA